jgi:hypothetical protein
LGDIVSSRPNLPDHHALYGVHAAEQRQHAIRIFPLQILVDIQKRVGDELHPQFFDLVHDLELQLVLVTEFCVVGLAAEERFGAQVDFVVQCAFSIHDGVELLSVHSRPPNTEIPIGLLRLKYGRRERKGSLLKTQIH